MKAMLMGIIMIVSINAALPKTFDLRVQPMISKYADYSVMFQPYCQAYSWAQQLAQIIGNAASIQTPGKKRPSGQQIVECIKTTTDMCKEVTLQNIMAGIAFIQKEGITERSCYLNNYLQRPATICKRKCHDDTNFPEHFQGIFHQEQSDEDLCTMVGNGEASGFLIMKLYDRMNYYSSENPSQMRAEGAFYGYGIGEIVGWKMINQQIQYMVRLGGDGWGYKGYGYVSASDSKIVVKKYSVKYLNKMALVQ